MTNDPPEIHVEDEDHGPRTLRIILILLVFIIGAFGYWQLDHKSQARDEQDAASTREMFEALSAERGAYVKDDAEFERLTGETMIEMLTRLSTKNRELHGKIAQLQGEVKGLRNRVIALEEGRDTHVTD